MDIQPKFLTLNELLNGRLLRIPRYQRAYSWTSKERRDLFSDMEKVEARPGSTHFMATVVGLRRETRIIRNDPFHVIEVVDGQQRLTTLVILMKAIEKVLADTDEDERLLREELGRLLVKRDDVAPVLLQTNHDSSGYCSDYLHAGIQPASSSAKTAADRRLLEAMEECEAFVVSWTGKGQTLARLLALVKHRLQFIFHEISDEALVYSVFEVLNSRGLEVSWFDRLKSVLMGIAFEAQGEDSKEATDELHRIWGDIYACAGLHQDWSTEALRFAATLRSAEQPRRPLNEADSVEELRTKADRTARGAIDVSNWLLDVTRAVDRLRSDRRLDAVTDIVQARLLAVAILLRGDLSQADRDDLLNTWERVTFRIYGMYRKDSRTKVGDYVRLAWECKAESPTVEKIRAGIRAIGNDFPIAQAVEQLKDANCYEEWQTDLRYFLFRYEEHLAREGGAKFENAHWLHIWSVTPSRSIEHVYPQSKGEAQQTESGIFVHRLGNLILLPPDVNSGLRDKDPADKAEAYLRTGLQVALDVARRMPPWNRSSVQQREDELLAWAAQEWGD